MTEYESFPTEQNPTNAETEQPPEIPAETEAEKSIEKIPSRHEISEKEYKKVADWRDLQYEKDVEADPNQEPMKANLEIHNGIVLDYANRLIELNPALTPEEKTAATIATILHDGGKLKKDSLLSHHELGAERAGIMMDEISGSKFENVEINEKIKKKVQEAIERHMNHPFLVKMNKDRRFPEPQDNVDKIVFDADMLANIGFKNVGFRLINEGFLAEDAQKSQEKNVSILRESFENVMNGARKLGDVVLSEQAKKISETLVGNTEKIFAYLNENKILEKIQEDFSKNGTFNAGSIKENGGVSVLKAFLNEEIRKAGEALNLDKKEVKNFSM